LQNIAKKHKLGREYFLWLIKKLVPRVFLVCIVAVSINSMSIILIEHAAYFIIIIFLSWKEIEEVFRV
jgi:hypothetical protein